MIYLQAASQPSSFLSLAFFGAIFLIMYFFFLRPQVKKQKEQNKFSDDLKKGDEVVTGAGIIGKISKIEDGIIHLQVDQKTFIRVVKGAISREMTEMLHKVDKEEK